MIFRRLSIPLTELREHVDPVAGELWGCQTLLTEDEIKQAESDGRFESTPWDTVKDQRHGPGSRDFHIGRIAYLVQHGWQDDEHTIRLNLDTTLGKSIGIDNGNHRICAALVRGDESLNVSVYFFDEADLARLLPGATEL